jgi:hypothetical protein
MRMHADKSSLPDRPKQLKWRDALTRRVAGRTNCVRQGRSRAVFRLGCSQPQMFTEPLQLFFCRPQNTTASSSDLYPYELYCAIIPPTSTNKLQA